MKYAAAVVAYSTIFQKIAPNGKWSKTLMKEIARVFPEEGKD